MRKQLPWMATVAVGDVLISGRGLARVVRRVTRFRDGDLRSLSFSIKRCSWTGRGYTVKNYTDLRYEGFTPTGIRVKLNSKLDKLLDRDIHLACTADPKRITCCIGKDMP